MSCSYRRFCRCQEIPLTIFKTSLTKAEPQTDRLTHRHRSISLLTSLSSGDTGNNTPPRTQHLLTASLVGRVVSVKEKNVIADHLSLPRDSCLCRLRRRRGHPSLPPPRLSTPPTITHSPTITIVASFDMTSSQNILVTHNW